MAETTETRVGFAGMGSMGFGLAHNVHKYLKESGQALMINNRTKEKTEVNKMLEDGAVWCDSPAELASKCDIVFTSMLADSALQSVFSNYLSGNPKKGSVFIDASTVYPDLTEKLEAEAAKHGVQYLACPVFGRPDAALAGKTLVVASGCPEGKAKAMPYLKAMGRGVVDVGDSARKGHVMKLVGNFYIMSMMELIAEGMTLADKNGLQREALVHFLKESFQGPITGGYAERTARDQFKITPEEPGFNSLGGLKDATHIQNLARQSGCALPVADLVVQHFEELKERADAGALDWASITLLSREKAGIKDEQNLLRKA